LNQSNKLVVALIAICAAIWIIAAINPMRKCRSEFGRKIFSISRAIITTVFAHGAFGFLLAFPIRELLLRFSGIRRGVWSFALPVAIILAVSGCFEIIESIVAEIVAPGKGVQWLGGQGDEWDAQNDMVSALVGSLLMVGVVALLQRTEARPRFHSVPVSPAGRDARASGSEGTGVGWGEEDAERNIFAHSNARDIAKHFLPIAVVCYVAFWIALAIHPLDRSDWLLENLLAVILLKGATANGALVD